MVTIRKLPREPGGQLLKASWATPTGVSGQGSGRVCAGQWFCSEVSTPPPFGKLSHLHSSGKGAVFLILESLIPSLIQGPQHCFPFANGCRSLLPETGSVFAFGENKMGQLGLGNQTDAVPSPAQVPPAFPPAPTPHPHPGPLLLCFRVGFSGGRSGISPH